GTNTATGTRAVLRRDINLPDGGTLDPVDMTSADSFAPTSTNVNVQGTGSTGEIVSWSMTLLTTNACTANTMTTLAPTFQFGSNGTANVNVGMVGIPDIVLRPT